MATYEDNLATLKEQIENVTSAVEEAAEVEAVTLAEVPALVLQIKEDADSNVGKCFYTAICFKRSSTIPNTPEGGTWKKVLNDFQFTPPEGWTLSIAPAEDDQDQFVPIWMSTAIFDSSKETLVSSWTTPVRISGLSGTAGSNGKDGVDGTNGTNGTDGDAVYRTVVYKRSSEEPSRPGNSEGNYNNPCPTGWSLSIPAGTDDLWSTSRTFTKSGSGLQDVSWAAVAKIGSIGKTGCIVYPAGIYSTDSTYGVNNNSVPYVAYTSNSNTNYYYLNPEVTDPSPKTRSVPGSSSDWIKMNYFNSVVTDLIVANQGTVGGFMFINEDECSYMISVLGTYYDSSGLSEQTTVTECISSYSGCTLDVTWSLSGEELTNVFQPYMSISTDGTILCNNAKLTGVINATSGSIGGINIESNKINSSNNKFSVDNTGKLTAASGTIGGITIDDTGLEATDVTNGYFSVSSKGTLECLDSEASTMTTISKGQIEVLDYSRRKRDHKRIYLNGGSLKLNLHVGGAISVDTSTVLTYSNLIADESFTIKNNSDKHDTVAEISLDPTDGLTLKFGSNYITIDSSGIHSSVPITQG